MRVRGLIPPQIKYTYQTFEDGSGSSHGNSDRIVQNGERVELKVNIENSGQGDARDVRVRLIHKGRHIRMIEDFRSVGKIPPGRTAKVTFSFEVLQTFDDDEIPFRLVVDERHDMGLTDSFSLSAGVLRPVLTFTHKIDDNRGGNGNSTLEAGERADLVVTVFNKGKGDAIDVEVKLDTDSSLVMDKLKSLGRLKKGDYQRKVFFPISIPEGHRDDAIRLKVSVFDPRGYEDTGNISLAVKGMIPPNLKYRFQVIDDGLYNSQGNGNGKVENGETIALRFTMTNYGEGKAREVSLKAYTDYSEVVLREKRCVFGEINPQGSRDGKIIFSVPPGFDESKIPLRLVISEKYDWGFAKEETIPVRLVKPVLTYSFEIEDFGRNSNGIADPNESIDLKFKVKNMGEAIAEKVKLQFDGSLPENIRKQSGLISLGTIKPGGEKEGTLSIFVRQTFLDKEILLPIKISEQYGRGMKGSVRLTLGSKQDLEVPTIIVQSPGNREHIKENTARLTVTISDNILLGDDIRFYINQQPFTASDGLKLKKEGDKLVLSGNIPIEEGENSLLIVAEDKAGNKGTKRITVFGRQRYRQEEMLSPPEIRIAEPRNNQEINREREKVKFLAFINDDKDISRYILRVNGEVYRFKPFSGSQKEQTFSPRGPGQLVGVNLSITADSQLERGKEIRIEGFVELQNGQNNIELVAFDNDNLSRSANVVVTVAIAEPDILGTYYALIIGNNDYKYLKNLQTAKNDAKVISKILREKYNFKTRLLLDATRVDISQAFNAYTQTLGENDSFLIYYAGHGIYDEAGKKAYWLPVDAEENDDTRWIIADSITTKIRRIASKHVLVVADSCYSGTLARDVSIKVGSNRFLQKMLKKTSRTLLASGGNEPVSDSGGEGHSIFADALIQGLNNMEQNIFTAEQLYYEHIKERVAGSAEQTPEYKIIRNSGHEGGDFVFKRSE